MNVEPWKRPDGVSKGYAIVPHSHPDCDHTITALWVNMIDGTSGRRIWHGPVFQWGASGAPWLGEATTREFAEGLSLALSLPEPFADEPPPEIGR